ncbi:Homeodomain-like protein [Chlamydoabsidia padenii]|nr:Homeodomain-like protein [Chlamydoabsidia padenii]
MMNDTNAFLLMEQQSNELRCGGLSGISSSSDQSSTWLSSPTVNITSTTTNSACAALEHHQQYKQKNMTLTMTPPSTLSQRRYSTQSSPGASPSVNTVMMVDIPNSTSSSSSSTTSSSSSPNTITPHSATTPSAQSTCSPPPAHYWSSNSSSATLYQNQNHYRQQQSLPATPVQYHQSPFMQSPIVSTTRSHSVKRNKLRQSTYTRWSLEEDECLKQAVAMHGPHKWSLIASHVPNRTPMQCSTRWLGALNPNIHKGRWTEYEDNILKYSVLEYANVMDNQGRIQPIPWNRIADRIPNRTGIQCQARWTEALDPYVRKGKWGADEDQLLRAGVKDHGRCWIRIAETIPGRTQRQCRTRWMQLQSSNNNNKSNNNQIKHLQPLTHPCWVIVPPIPPPPPLLLPLAIRRWIFMLTHLRQAALMMLSAQSQQTMTTLLLLDHHIQTIFMRPTIKIAFILQIKPIRGIISVVAAIIVMPFSDSSITHYCHLINNNRYL